MGNGYIVSVYYPDAPGSNNGEPIDQLTTFTMTMAELPILATIESRQGYHHLERRNPLCQVDLP